MRILIENQENLQYWTDTNQWSENPLKGKPFISRRVALRAAKLEDIGKFNIVFYIPDTKQFINLDHGHGVHKSVKADVNES
jgi:hypothetical protein